MANVTGRALLVIDVQNEYFTGKLPVTHPVGSLANILQAMDAAMARRLPVVMIQHAAPQPNATVFRAGSPGWELHPEIAARPHDVLFHKSLPGSFTGTALEGWLRERKIGTVTIAGYMTQMCCDTTARQALHLGFSVEFLSDATGTLAFRNTAGEISAEDLHRAILITQQARFSQVMPVRNWVQILDQGCEAAKMQ
jgi:nicotinamidase-related amidase